MPRNTARLSRRGMLVGSVATSAVVATGCDQVAEVFGGDGGVTPSPGAVTPTADAVDSDSALVAEVVDALARASALATASGAAVPALAPLARRLSRLHDAHADELGGAETAPAPKVTGGRAVVRRRLLATEASLQADLLDAAQRAGSGALARVLASMAAAVAQQRAVAA